MTVTNNDSACCCCDVMFSKRCPLWRIFDGVYPATIKKVYSRSRIRILNCSFISDVRTAVHPCHERRCKILVVRTRALLHNFEQLCTPRRTLKTWLCCHHRRSVSAVTRSVVSTSRLQKSFCALAVPLGPTCRVGNTCAHVCALHYMEICGCSDDADREFRCTCTDVWANEDGTPIR
jgi:hypothetical protein